MLTGQLPHASGVSVLNTPLSPENPTVANQLRAAGYNTAVVGKMHWNCKPEPPQPGIHGFDLAMADQNAWQTYCDSVADRTLEFRYFGAHMPLPDGIPIKPHYRDFVDPSASG
jgi:arylsulfatase A-like enzyme